jgi:hypothetical protein
MPLPPLLFFFFSTKSSSARTFNPGLVAVRGRTRPGTLFAEQGATGLLNGGANVGRDLVVVAAQVGGRRGKPPLAGVTGKQARRFGIEAKASVWLAVQVDGVHGTSLDGRPVLMPVSSMVCSRDIANVMGASS